MTKFEFDRMQISDLDTVMKIECENYPVPWTKGIMKDCINAGYHCILIKNNNQIMGYAFLMTSYDESHLLNMCVAQKYHGQGIGRRLLIYLENICIYSCSKLFLLEVRESNVVAHGLYKSHGFEQIGIRKNYYKCIQGRENAIVMTKPINRNYTL